jgi:hypothetical protein
VTLKVQPRWKEILIDSSMKPLVVDNEDDEDILEAVDVGVAENHLSA